MLCERFTSDAVSTSCAFCDSTEPSRRYNGCWSGAGCGGRRSAFLVRGLFNARRCVCLGIRQLLFEYCRMYIAVFVGHREWLHFVSLALHFKRRIDPISGQQRAVVDTAASEWSDSQEPQKENGARKTTVSGSV